MWTADYIWFLIMCGATLVICELCARHESKGYSNGTNANPQLHGSVRTTHDTIGDTSHAPGVNVRRMYRDNRTATWGTTTLHSGGGLPEVNGAEGSRT